jgi:hypothetical protein
MSAEFSNQLSRNAEHALRILTHDFAAGTLRGPWLRAWQDARGGRRVYGNSDDTFDRCKDELLASTLIDASGKGKGVVYRVRCGQTADEVVDLGEACAEAAYHLAGKDGL